MPRMHVHLPDDLYQAVKQNELSPSVLLQDAVRAELRLRSLGEETDRYLAELIDAVGPPSDEAVAKAEAVASRLRCGAPAPTSG